MADTVVESTEPVKGHGVKKQQPMSLRREAPQFVYLARWARAPIKYSREPLEHMRTSDLPPRYSLRKFLTSTHLTFFAVGYFKCE